MSDDNKKNGKKGFFRINTRGEISETSEKPEVTTAGTEPHKLSDESNEDTANRSNELDPITNLTEPISSEELNLTEQPNSEDSLEPQLFNVIESESEIKEEILTNNESLLPPEAPIQLPQDSSPEGIETLRNYISLKEKECEDLKEQQKQYQQVLVKLKRTHAEALLQNNELQSQIENIKLSESLVKKELNALKEKHEYEISVLKNDFEQQQMQNGNFQQQLSELARQKSVWKEKISEDLKKIKLKEKELENRYELLKKDTETLLDSKDQQILALRKKTDALDLELETFEERLISEHAILNSIESKKRKLIETLKLAISLLESIDSNESPEDERKAG